MKKYNYRTFREFFKHELWDDIENIINGGATVTSFVYTAPCAAIFDQYQDDIWDIVSDEADEQGYKNTFDLVKDHGMYETNKDSFMTIKQLLFWIAIEVIAYEEWNDPKNGFPVD